MEQREIESQMAREKKETLPSNKKKQIEAKQQER